MKITNEFDVGVPIAQTWTTMLDVPRVARALPGAKIDPETDGGVWRGTMKIKLGPVTTEYAGTARIDDVDDDEHVASFRVEGREARGQGGAAATITVRLAPNGGGTHVVVETDMQVTGRQAQLGRGLMEDVAGAILGDFAQRLERELRGEASGAGDPGGPGDAGDGDDALDVSAAIRGPLLQRAALIGAGVLVGLVLGVLAGMLAWRRRAAPASASRPAGWPAWPPPAGWAPAAPSASAGEPPAVGGART